MRKILKVSKNVKSANFWQIILKKYKKSKKIYFLEKEEKFQKICWRRKNLFVK